MHIYLHRPRSDLERIEVSEETRVRDLVDEEEDGEEFTVWLEDSEEPLDLDATLADAGVSDRAHVHVARCRRIEVRVRYGGETKEREFAPAATIARVFEWATGKRGFELTESERAKHTLGLCDTLTQPDKAEHVGTLAGADCALCLDLAPKERFEG